MISCDFFPLSPDSSPALRPRVKSVVKETKGHCLESLRLKVVIVMCTVRNATFLSLCVNSGKIQIKVKLDNNNNNSII